MEKKEGKRKENITNIEKEKIKMHFVWNRYLRYRFE